MVEVEGIATSALLNTGSARLRIPPDVGENRGRRLRHVVGDPYIEIRGDGAEPRAREVILRSVRNGGVVERRVRAMTLFSSPWRIAGCIWAEWDLARAATRHRSRGLIWLQLAL